MARYSLLVSIATGLLLVPLSAQRPTPAYRLVTRIAVPGDGGWDYVSLDAGARRLYVTHGTKVDVVDVDAQAVVGTIANTPRPHGFAIAPELHRGFSSNGAAATLSIVDLTTLKTLMTVPSDTEPNGILYEPGRQEVYCFNRSEPPTTTVYDAKSGRRVARIVMPGRVEAGAADPAAHRVYDNIESKNAIVGIDTATHSIVSTWPIAPGEAASGMVIDPVHHRLFIGTDNKLLIMLDSATGRVLSTVPIDAGVDTVAFDPGTQLVFSSNGAGTVTVAHEESASTLRVVQVLPTEVGARTMAVDPATHRIYLASATLGGPLPRPGDTPAHDAATRPGTFKVLVYGQ